MSRSGTIHHEPNSAAAQPDDSSKSEKRSKRMHSDLPPSAARRRDWAETLLALSLDLSPEDKPQEMVVRVVETIHGLAPALGVGVSIQLRTDQAPYVTTRRPIGCEWDAVPHPERLFPGAPLERIVRLPGGPNHASLHLAADEDEAAAGAIPLEHLIEYGGRLLSVSLARARTYRRNRRVSTSIHRLQAHLIQTEKLASLGQLVAGIVHELNNPLTSIITYSDYLRGRAQCGEQSLKDLEYFGRISEAANRILRFARDLTTYSRPACGSLEPTAITVPLEKALLFCEHEFDRNGVSVVRRYDPILPEIYGVGDQLTQVFVNLFTNAVHAMKESGGKLEVSAQSAGFGTEVVVQVCDDGTGIAEPALQHIFEPFFTTKGDGRGTGLGLSIVQGIVKAHGGSIEAERRSAGGSRFTLRLPAATPDSAADSLPPAGDADDV